VGQFLADWPHIANTGKFNCIFSIQSSSTFLLKPLLHNISFTKEILLIQHLHCCFCSYTVMSSRRFQSYRQIAKWCNYIIHTSGQKIRIFCYTYELASFHWHYKYGVCISRGIPIMNVVYRAFLEVILEWMHFVILGPFSL